MHFLSLALLTGLVSAALPPIEVRGNAFYTKGSDERFYIKGIDYQPGGSSKLVDPLKDNDACARDIKNFKDLGVNMVRVYTIDNSADHSDCMKALDDAGIYVLLDVNTPKHSLNRADEKELKLSYNSDYLQHVFAVIDKFKDYSNLFGFFAANEVINAPNNTFAAPYIKAVVRDMKKYIKNQADRKIPVGYSAADIDTSRWEQLQYFNCGDDEERVDMFGMNDYAYCGDKSSFEESGWANRVEEYKDYGIPLFLSEYGCNVNRPRTFPEVKVLYSEEMSPVYSGGLLYEYSEEANNYGIVKIDGNSVQKLPEYDNFKKALSDAKTPSGDGGAKSQSSSSKCPSYQKGAWEIDNENIPVTPKYARKYFKEGAGKGTGLTGNTQSGSEHDMNDQSNWDYSSQKQGSGSKDNGSDDDASSSGSGSSSKTNSAGKESQTGGSGKSSSNEGAAVAAFGLAPIVSLVLMWLW